MEIKVKDLQAYYQKIAVYSGGFLHKRKTLLYPTCVFIIGIVFLCSGLYVGQDFTSTTYEGEFETHNHYNYHFITGLGAALIVLVFWFFFEVRSYKKKNKNEYKEIAQIMINKNQGITFSLKDDFFSYARPTAVSRMRWSEFAYFSLDDHFLHLHSVFSTNQVSAYQIPIDHFDQLQIENLITFLQEKAGLRMSKK